MTTITFDYSERTGQCWMYSETYSMTFVLSSAWESEKCLSASSFERNSFAQTVHLNVPPSYSDISQGKGQGVFIGKGTRRDLKLCGRSSFAFSASLPYSRAFLVST